MQVLDERVYHIEYAPEQPEPYYKATGKELQPRAVGEDHGIIVYNYMPISAVHYVSILNPTQTLLLLLLFLLFKVIAMTFGFSCVFSLFRINFP